MKVFVPRNIEKWWFNMHFQLGPLNVSLIQLVLLAVGAWMALMVWNGVAKWSNSKALATIFAIPILWVFLFIAFFRISELPLIPFVAKLFRNRFLDTNKKFQRNSTTKIDPLHIAIESSKAQFEDTQVQEKKTLGIEEIGKNRTKSDDLLS